LCNHRPNHLKCDKTAYCEVAPQTSLISIRAAHHAIGSPARLQAELDDVERNGHPTQRLPHTLTVSMPGVANIEE